MKTQEALIMLCVKLSEVFNEDFPCICGENKLSTYLTQEEVENLHKVLDCLDLLKENPKGEK